MDRLTWGIVITTSSLIRELRLIVLAKIIPKLCWIERIQGTEVLSKELLKNKSDYRVVRVSYRRNKNKNHINNCTTCQLKGKIEKSVTIQSRFLRNIMIKARLTLIRYLKPILKNRLPILILVLLKLDRTSINLMKRY